MNPAHAKLRLDGSVAPAVQGGDHRRSTTQAKKKEEIAGRGKIFSEVISTCAGALGCMGLYHWHQHKFSSS
jgi:hypothetical protein